MTYKYDKGDIGNILTDKDFLAMPESVAEDIIGKPLLTELKQSEGKTMIRGYDEITSMGKSGEVNFVCNDCKQIIVTVPEKSSYNVVIPGKCPLCGGQTLGTLK